MVFLILSILLIAALISQITTQDLLRLAARLTIGQIALLCGLYLITTFFRAVRLAYIVQDRHYAALTAITGIHAFLNHILPFRMGELTLPILIKAFTPKGIVAGSVSLLIMRLYDVASIALLMLLSLGLAYTEIDSQLGTAMILALALVGVGLATGFCFLPWFLKTACRVLARLARLAGQKGQRLAQRIDLAAGQIDAQWHALSFRQRYLVLPGTSLVIQLSIYTFFYLTMTYMGIDIGFFKNMLASSGELVTGLLPINMIGSFGTLEAGWAAGYILCGIAPVDAIATGFIVHGMILLSGFLISAAGAVYLLFARKHKKSNHE
ncbi:MAG: hypothetical protein A2X46_06405 [Lentisphaerae bacterium GWF2_57_35]|nr:MAG: hypothetical protein A2X46_06405 [Lentisphaerae bacterium GWF2_57_35]